MKKPHEEASADGLSAAFARRFLKRKPRADSKLKTLPPDRQAAICQFARDHTLQATIKWLRAEGVKSSSQALSEFLSWYRLRQELLRSEIVCRA